MNLDKEKLEVHFASQFVLVEYDGRLIAFLMGEFVDILLEEALNQ